MIENEVARWCQAAAQHLLDSAHVVTNHVEEIVGSADWRRHASVEFVEMTHHRIFSFLCGAPFFGPFGAVITRFELERFVDEPQRRFRAAIDELGAEADPHELLRKWPGQVAPPAIYIAPFGEAVGRSYRWVIPMRKPPRLTNSGSWCLELSRFGDETDESLLLVTPVLASATVASGR